MFVLCVSNLEFLFNSLLAPLMAIIVIILLLVPSPSSGNVLLYLKFSLLTPILLHPSHLKSGVTIANYKINDAGLPSLQPPLKS